MGKKGLEFEERVTADQAALFLEEIAKGLRLGVLEVSSADRTVRLTPATVLKLELEASVDDGKQELGLELKWRTSELRAGGDIPDLDVAAWSEPAPVPPSDTDR
jgi:amphi-Trp domain-containing protein